MTEQSGTICTILLGNIPTIIQGLFLISTITIAIIGFKKFRKRQIEIARLDMLRSIETDIIELFKTRTVRIGKQEADSISIKESREFRSILDRPEWQFIVDESATDLTQRKPPKDMFIDGQRYWFVGTDSEGNKRFLASQALQETLLWFRRIARAHRSKVISDDDLADLWRWTLPFGISGRLVYFANYFGDKDIEALVYIINSTLRHCLNSSLQQPIEFFKNFRPTKEDSKRLTVTKEYQDLHNRINNKNVQTTQLSD